MSRTYKAILHDDRVEWLDRPPDSSHPLQVQITLVEELRPDPSRGRTMAESLALLASRGAFSAITDPVTWQREEQRDRDLLACEP